MEANCSFCGKLSNRVILIEGTLTACLGCMSKTEPLMIEEENDVENIQGNRTNLRVKTQGKYLWLYP